MADAEIVEAAAWHALDVAAVAQQLGTGPTGLRPDEVRQRRDRVGPNLLPEAPPRSNLAIFFSQFRSPLIYILLVAALVTLALQDYIDSAVIAAVLALNAAIGFVQERRAEHSVRALQRLLSPHARVVRDGVEEEVESRDLVPGDLVLLESGVRVPADLRLVVTTALLVDESLLTGESTTVAKSVDTLPPDTGLADRRNMAYTGSIVVSGRGRGYVVVTGTSTELGNIAGQVREEAKAETPLQRRMSAFAGVIGLAVGAASLAAFAIGLAFGETAVEMFKVAVAMAVAAVPEGLPVVLTITLALGVRRMARRNAIVRRLPAVETLGSTTVIGSDKTGTLTENRMTVVEVWAPGSDRPVPVDGLATDDGIPEPTRLLLLAGVLTNEAQLYVRDGGLELHGDPTEAALLVAAYRLGVMPETVRRDYPIEADLPFEPDRRFSATARVVDGTPTLFVKGAPERLLGMSSQMLTPAGPLAIDADAVHRAAAVMAARGLRVLAMAFRALTDGEDPNRLVAEPSELVFLGLQGMIDPPRPGVREAIAGCQQAGIRVLMITGDHPATAAAIARELGLATADAPVVTGRDLSRMDDAALRETVAHAAVFARVEPEHKLRVVRALQARGEVVAVTGDGVNDAPALKAADIGIAMGRSGTDVAREAADMVLADDNFVTIYAAVDEGRVTFENVRKVTFFLVSTGVAAIVAVLASQLLRWPLPFLPAQMLWLNLVTNGLQDVALAFEPGERDLLRRRPRRASEGVLSWLLWERTLIAGVVMAVGTLWLFRWELDRGGTLAQAQTVALTTMVLFQMFQAGNARSERRSVFAVSPISNRFLLLAAVGALAVHALALYAPPTQFILRVEPVSWDTWLRMGAVAATLIAAMELHKLVRSR